MFHDIRHTTASYLAALGYDLHMIATILGHKSIQATMRYAHLIQGRKAEVGERLAKRFFG